MPHLIVLYGHPSDPAAFDAHYIKTHKPLADQIPGVVRWHAGHCTSVEDTQPEHYAAAVLTFGSNEELAAGMASPEGHAAVADIPNYATGGATVMVIDDLV